MCGIVGFISTNTDHGQWRNILSRMAKAVAHRGPDDEGIWIDTVDGVGLAHRRLSIIDLSAEGHQPMISHSGRYVITYNGEIYNYQEIHNELDTFNIPWRGSSDTEVILEAIDHWGLENAVKKFVGMFAFGLWDRKKKILYLCRDRIGIKPLYYSHVKDGILFGSELKSLRAHPSFEPVIDRNSLGLYFRHNYIPSPYSIFKNTWKLLPGTILSLDLEKFEKNKALPEPEAYWAVKDVAERGEASPHIISEDNAVRELDRLLTDAISLRMVSDVPLGAFLSGGIDSTTVVSIMQAQSNQKINTFSIGFTESDFDEAEYAKSVAAFLKTDHHELYLTPNETMGMIPGLPELYDEPFSDSSQIPTYLLSKFTKNHVTVSLSGDGGDELFCGYNQYLWGERFWKYMRFLPVMARRTGTGIIKKIPVSIWDGVFNSATSILPSRYAVTRPGDRLHKLTEVISAESPEKMYEHLVSHWHDTTRLVRDSETSKTIFNTLDTHPALDNLMHKMMFMDMVAYLPDDILTKVDRASMGVSLEARVPLLDHRIVEFAWSLPLSMKIRANQTKWILRQVLYKYVPQNLFDRPKSGFSIPLETWLRGPLKDWVESLLQEAAKSSADLLNINLVRNIWKEHLSGARDWKYVLWAFLMFQAWKTHNRL